MYQRLMNIQYAEGNYREFLNSLINLNSNCNDCYDNDNSFINI